MKVSGPLVKCRLERVKAPCCVEVEKSRIGVNRRVIRAFFFFLWQIGVVKIALLWVWCFLWPIIQQFPLNTSLGSVLTEQRGEGQQASGEHVIRKGCANAMLGFWVVLTPQRYKLLSTGREGSNI